MNNRPDTSDSLWPMVFSHAAHELRTPLSVAAGYLRMVLKESAGPINDKQRHFLTEIEKATTRIHALTNEMSELAKYETEKPPFERTPVDLGALVDETVASLPPLPDREVEIQVDNRAPGGIVQGDRKRLRTALGAVIFAIRRELVASPRLVVRLRRESGNDGAGIRVAIAGDHRIDDVDALPLADLVAFNEKRGGCGLAPSIARRVFVEHNGRIWSTPDRHESAASLGETDALTDNRRAEAVLVLPEAV